jgi:hypothetical protein
MVCYRTPARRQFEFSDVCRGVDASHETMTMQIDFPCRRSAVLAALLALSAAGIMGGCAGLKKTAGEAPERIRQTRSLPPAPSPQPHRPAEPTAPKAAAARDAAAAFSGNMLSVRSTCNSRDATGYTESIRLSVDQGQVQALEAKIVIPRRGSCGFRLADFHQTRSAPHVELRASSSTQCTVRMWEQSGRFTVAFSDCHEKCTRGAFDYVWPVELNSADGSCL